MKITVALGLVILTLLAYPTSASPRRRRQAHVEFRKHFYPFKEMCAQKLGVGISGVSLAMGHGLGGSQFCANFVLTCQDKQGHFTHYMEQCGIGMWWSFKIGTCDIPSLADRPDCAEEVCPSGSAASVPDPRACFAFYECEAGMAFFEMCEDGSYFNPDKQSCENSPLCDRPAPRTKPNGMPCTQADMPKVCTPPGYIPSLAYCGCVHQHLER